jgi:flagellar motor switch/type III secretory pathway protein FliN
MTSCQAWLPPIALFDGVLSEKIGGWTRRWEQRWFREPKGLSIRVSAGGGASSTRPAVWGTPCGGLVLALEEAALHRLACTLLGIRKPPRKISTADWRLLRSVSDACIRDLISDLAGGLGLSKDVVEVAAPEFQTYARTAIMRFAVNSGALPRSLDVYLGQDAAVGARKAHAPAPREPRVLGTRRSAIEAQEIRVGACIGWGQVELADLCSLAPNDVLVLDGALGKELVLLINGRRTTDPGIELIQTGSALVLRERASDARAA